MRKTHISERQLAHLVKRCLHSGDEVFVDRLGVFRLGSQGRLQFDPSTRPRVFIAYVEEDLRAARRVFDALQTAGFDAWMDRVSLLPGQNWPRAIERAIEIADFFVACLSPASVCKRGTFQHELRWAMDIGRRVPLDDIFFVPVRLSECTVPRRIQQHWQYVDLFPRPQRGRARLIRMMKNEWARRLAQRATSRLPIAS